MRPPLDESAAYASADAASDDDADEARADAETLRRH